MARVRRSGEVAIDDDRCMLHPGCAGGFSVRLHDRASTLSLNPVHAAACHDVRAGCQHRAPANASDDPASRADVLHELGDARIFGEQGSVSFILDPEPRRVQSWIQ
jgi:hypothetical protein